MNTISPVSQITAGGGTFKPTREIVITQTPEIPKAQDTKNLHTKPLSLDEVIFGPLLYFRQLDKEYLNDVYIHLGLGIDKLRWFANEKEMLNDASKITNLEKFVSGVPNLTDQQIKNLEAQKAKKLAPLVKVLFNTAQSVIKFFDQMKTLFPNMSEKDFENKVFSIRGAGLKDVVEALGECRPVTPKSLKKPTQKTHTAEIRRPIIGHETSRDILSAFADLLKAHGNEHNSSDAIKFATDLENLLKSTKKK